MPENLDTSTAPAAAPRPPVPAHGRVFGQPQTFLALDYGRKRVGGATGNRLLGGATPLGTVAAVGELRFQQLKRWIDEWQPDALVIGVPFHPDGAAHENTVAARAFGAELHRRFGKAVYEVDERYTTTEALSMGAKDADAAAAAIILEQFLSSWT